MLVAACRLADLSALGGYYADDNAQAQSGVEEPTGSDASSTVLGKEARRLKEPRLQFELHGSPVHGGRGFWRQLPQAQELMEFFQ
jgi:hypothetical protein